MASKIARSIALVGALGVWTLLTLATPAVAADGGVDIVGFAFSPGTVTVGVGDTVTWTNDDAQSHTATADDGSFDTGTIHGGGTASATFSTAGTFAYHCRIHSSMIATVVVTGNAPNAPATDAVAAAAGVGPSHGVPVVLALAAISGFLAAVWRLSRRVPGV
jgi:plastocyanin